MRRTTGLGIVVAVCGLMALPVGAGGVARAEGAESPRSLEVAYSTYFGGSGDDLPEFQFGLDSAGHVYLCGDTTSVDLPTTPGAFQTTFGGGGQDAFIAKLSRDGSRLLYATYLGGSGYEEGVGCTVDSSGRVYVTGPTTSTDFPITPGALQTTYGGGDRDGYVAKLNRSGSSLLYSTYLGGMDLDEGSVVAVDRRGHAFVRGFTASSEFPVTSNAYQTVYGGGASDGFVAKLSRDGSSLVYSTFLGGSGEEDPTMGLSVDERGDAYTVGFTDSRDFPTTPGALQPSYAGGLFDGFVTKLDARGSGLVYSTYLGGGDVDAMGYLAVDHTGHAYVEGYTASTDFPVTADAFQAANAGNGDAFVSKLDPSGSALRYSSYLGGTDYDTGFGLGIDADGHAYAAGLTFSSDFPVTADALQAENAGGGDTFVTKLSRNGPRPVFSTFLGGNGYDFGGPIDVSPAGDAFVVTCTSSADFPVTSRAFQPTFAGGDGTGLCGVPTDTTVTKLVATGHGSRTRAWRPGTSGTPPAVYRPSRGWPWPLDKVAAG